MSGKKLVATRELPREPNKQPSLASFGQCVSVRACVCKYAVRTLALSSLPDTESGFLSYERPPQNESEEEINRTGSFLALAPHFATTTIKQEERKEKIICRKQVEERKAFVFSFNPRSFWWHAG